ncbi:MAG TPA: hypothetical protein VFK85_16240 [Anaeromyxobacteraceae bacterium]|nr:hypothetical protein [Anaeromyxobacteraceae bacterium]
MAASAMALPLTLLMIGSGGGLIFDSMNAFNQLGFWRWIGVALGLVELGLGVGVWIPYLHRLVGAVIAVDALMHLAINARAQRPGWVLMYAIILVMATSIALLWKTRIFSTEPKPTQREAHA